MGIEFYFDPLLPSCRAIQLTLSTLNLHTLSATQVDSVAASSDDRNPDLLRVNPLHSVPTLVDNGLVLTEARAIQIYLAEKYARDEKLYPKDLVARTIVHERLFLDQALSGNFVDYWYLHKVIKKVTDKHRLRNITTGIKTLEHLLRGQSWVAGDYMTIADIALVATISGIAAFNIDLEACPNICKWFAKCRQVIPGYEANELGVKEFVKFNSIKR